MFLENERGSIREDKYADFLLFDKDVPSCPETGLRDHGLIAERRPEVLFELPETVWHEGV